MSRGTIVAHIKIRMLDKVFLYIFVKVALAEK